MNQMNLCIIEGNVVRDPEIKSLENTQNTVTAFSIAQHKSYVNAKKEMVEDVNFINVEVWGAGFAEKVAGYLKKGTLARIQGRLKQNVWLDTEGKKHEKLIIVAENVDFMFNSPKTEEVIITGEKLNDSVDVEIIESGHEKGRKRANRSENS